MHTYIYVWFYKHEIYTNIHTNKYLWINIHVYTFIHIHVCIYISTFLFFIQINFKFLLFSYIFWYSYILLKSLFMYICIYMYTHTQTPHTHTRCTHTHKHTHRVESEDTRRVGRICQHIQQHGTRELRAHEHTASTSISRRHRPHGVIGVGCGGMGGWGCCSG